MGLFSQKSPKLHLAWALILVAALAAFALGLKPWSLYLDRLQYRTVSGGGPDADGFWTTGSN
ncbi:MAG TPA: hypothetical protein VMJ31_01290 [Methylocystis sp.]|nr:hypothetical protein [Methylocystis sp.]